MNILSNDSMIGRIFDFIGHLIMLNLLWILCCIPVITIGPATTALYYSVLRMHKGSTSAALKDYLKSFKNNFRQSCSSGILLTIVYLFLTLERNFLYQTEGVFAELLSYGILSLLILWYILVIYLFPVISAFSNSLLHLIGHAFYFAFRHIFYLLPIVSISFFPMYFTFADSNLLPLYLFFWLSIGFAITAYLNSWFFYRLFQPHLSKKT